VARCRNKFSTRSWPNWLKFWCGGKRCQTLRAPAALWRAGEDADYSAGSPSHEKPFYFIEIRIPINRLDLLAKQGLIRDFTHVVLEAEKSDNTRENARRIWVTINELKAEDWGIGGHSDWLRDYTSALDDVGEYTAPAWAATPIGRIPPVRMTDLEGQFRVDFACSPSGGEWPLFAQTRRTSGADGFCWRTLLSRQLDSTLVHQPPSISAEP
jgi:phenylpyruvate tautomerase PptA (4-oxalocrotonate tautomerase family)